MSETKGYQAGRNCARRHLAIAKSGKINRSEHELDKALPILNKSGAYKKAYAYGFYNYLKQCDSEHLVTKGPIYFPIEGYLKICSYKDNLFQQGELDVAQCIETLKENALNNSPCSILENSISQHSSLSYEEKITYLNGFNLSLQVVDCSQTVKIACGIDEESKDLVIIDRALLEASPVGEDQALKEDEQTIFQANSKSSEKSQYVENDFARGKRRGRDYACVYFRSSLEALNESLKNFRDNRQNHTQDYLKGFKEGFNNYKPRQLLEPSLVESQKSQVRIHLTNDKNEVEIALEQKQPSLVGVGLFSPPEKKRCYSFDENPQHDSNLFKKSKV